LGYFTYSVEVTGRIRALTVVADARSGAVAAIRDDPGGRFSSEFKTHREVPGTCPLQGEANNTGK